MMTMGLACPDETELLVLALGEPVAAAVKAHVDGCAACRTRLDRLHVEVAVLRQNHECETPPSTELDPALEHDAEEPCTEPTKDWSPSEHSRFPRGPVRPGPEAVAAARELAEGLNEMPDAIGRYKVVGQLCSGGEADVYRVVHIKLDNDLVLKLSRRQVGPDSQSGLIDEGRLLIDLQHPNLVRIYDLDFHDNRPFLVMEYVHGRNLDDYARDEPVNHRRAAALAAKLAEVMAVAHRHGITHCDIKPKNILVDKLGEPRLIDFGMARMRHAWSDRVDSSVGGTVAYVAPEQARLELDRTGPRSDIFALGGVLYFLLTGSAPFQGHTYEEVWDRARRCDFEPCALRAAKVPRRLERICLTAMAAEPAGRYPTAEAMQGALKRYLAWPKVQAMVGGVCGVALLGLLLYVVVPRPAKEMPNQFIVPSPGKPGMEDQHVIPTPAGPLRGRIDLLVVKSKDGTRRRLRLADPHAVPLRAADEFRIEARLDRPAYLYLFWVGSEGKVAPLYPWKEHDWAQRPAEEQKVTGAELPEIITDILEIPASPPGLETLVLLARDDSPLPREDEAKLAQGLSGTPVPLPADVTKAIWIEDGEEVTFEPTAGLKDAVPRSMPSPTTRKSNDSVLRIRALLKEKVKPLGSYSQAVLFPNEGGS